MRVSVVVPTYRRPDLLARCLGALLRQSVPADDYEVIVADDASDEATKRLIASLDTSGVRLRYVAVSGRHGPAAARNAGWQQARGIIIAFTDDDCIPDSGWLAAGLAPFADPTVVAVTGQTIVPLPPEPTDFDRNTAGLEASEFITANCLCRRQALESIGGFDETFTLAWREDSDLHFRLLDTGGRIVRESAAVVIHPVRPAAWGVSLKEQRKAMFDALLFRKHPQHFRSRIYPAWPWAYYMTVISGLVAIGSALSANWPLAAAGAFVWCLFSLELVVRRLRSTIHSPAHVAEMLVTSLAIPFLSVFWRLYGALRFRTLFW
jgi:GT2 family glycosyltransferase